MNTPIAAIVAANLNAIANLRGGFYVVTDRGGPETVAYHESGTLISDRRWEHYVNITPTAVVMRKGHGNAKRLTSYPATPAGGISPEDAKKIIRTVKAARTRVIKNCQKEIAHQALYGKTSDVSLRLLSCFS